ncbi:MAG: HlyD family secretion protein [Verrucomicrobiota bacterium]|jgi:membrane fusion protein (multidrug efflux system)
MSENQPVPSNPPPPPQLNGAKLAKLNSPWFIWPATGALAVLLFFGLDYLVTAFTHESTDDAFIEAHVVSIAPRISGQVAAVHVLDNQIVRSNELLVEIDPADYSTTAAQKQSSADAQEANYKVVLAALDLMTVKVATAEATADQSKADADAAQATDARAQADFQRSQELRKQNTISQQEFDTAQATVSEADANLTAAKQKAVADASRINEAKAQLEATKPAVAMALALFRQAQTAVQSAQLDLSYTKIFAPSDGRVTRKSVEPGDYVQTGQTLFSIVPDDVWVAANFKETQLKHMRPGQPALVEIDAVGRSLRGHVDSLQAGSGARFSLLPPENATGNYVKVVQRVPVKIIFDEPLPAGHVIGPGLSVTPSVHVSSFEMPGWAIALLAVVLAGAAAFVFRYVLRRKMKM